LRHTAMGSPIDAAAARRSDNFTKLLKVPKRTLLIVLLKSSESFQPFPKTDPGLAGETGVSGEAGTVYGLDGLKTGGGFEGTLSNNGPRNPPPIWPPPNPPPPPPCPAARASDATAIVQTNTAAAATTPRSRFMSTSTGLSVDADRPPTLKGQRRRYH
jgi:hypothetical protein